jgi:AcrR family transcriptional regulator
MDAAADLFHRAGYHRVGTGDIAAAVGITAGALYRHFGSKQELLGEIILDKLQRYEQVFAETADEPLEDAVRSMVGYGLDHRELGILWQRESRQLPEGERDALRGRLRELARGLAERVGALRPELSGFRAELVAWSVIAVISSPTHSTIALPRPRHDEILTALAVSVLWAPPAERVRAPAGPDPDPALLAGRVSRREALLDAAVDLFARDGFQRTKMEDIGGAVGIAAPSIYNHFSGKPEILDASITRGTQWLQMLVTQVLGSAPTAADALESLLRAYAAFALRYTGIVEVLISETPHLPEHRRQAARQAQREFVSEWVRLLAVSRPDEPEVELRITVQTVLTIINDIARVQHLHAEPALTDELVAVCLAVHRG